MRNSTLEKIPEKAVIEIEKWTEGLNGSDINFEYHALFIYRGRKYYYWQGFDWNRGFFKDIYLMEDDEYQETLEDLETLKWDYMWRTWNRIETDSNQ